eukprot:TRINITY_DN8889_c0_g1_i6.p1 TRINITY_DN8889_c0_g1~~TRINITY_DN8889_c0_g1_i6.p1  ORF type:complete len:299 (+),score=34.48 TRINITY_DN8889_c0_g1_i6:825-1721(+)
MVGDKGLCARTLMELNSPHRGEQELPGDPELWAQFQHRVCRCLLEPQDVLNIAARIPEQACLEKVFLASDRQCGVQCNGCINSNHSGSFESWRSHPHVVTLNHLPQHVHSEGNVGSDRAGLFNRTNRADSASRLSNAHFLMMAELWALALARVRVSGVMSSVIATASMWAAVYNTNSITFPRDQLVVSPLRWASPKLRRVAFRSPLPQKQVDRAFAFADPVGKQCTMTTAALFTNDKVGGGLVDVLLRACGSNPSFVRQLQAEQRRSATRPPQPPPTQPPTRSQPPPPTRRNLFPWRR